MTKEFDDQGELSYPREWLYKVIGIDRQLVERDIRKAVDAATYRLTFSNQSRKKKYFAYNLQLTVRDKAHRDEIYRQLKSMPSVVMVL